jgi:hypothetical protein
MKKYIESAFIIKQKIDAIFISHLHNDHVNGLQFLIKYCEVKKIFLPEITPNQQIYLFIQQRIQEQTDTFLENLIQDPISTISGLDNDIEVILLPEIETETESNSEVSYFIEDLISKDKIESNSKLKFRKLENWIYLPFNLRQNISHTFTSFEEFEIVWSNPKNRNEIRKKYGSNNVEININSMTLYSGPDKTYEYRMEGPITGNYPFLYCQCRHSNFKNERVGCIYFGDFDAKAPNNWNAFKTFYKPYWDNSVGTVQIPHHGSKNNYNSEINNPEPKFSIMSAGITNSYQHPHIYIIQEIMINDGYPFFITELHSSLVMFKINTYHQSYIRRLKLRQIYKSIDIETQKNS